MTAAVDPGALRWSNAPSHRSTGRAMLWAAVAVMLATRMALVLALDVRQWSDLEWYYARAVELVTTGRYAESGISTAYWPVGYPGFLAGIMAIAGTSARVGQLANVALSLTCLLLLYAWCRRKFPDARVAGLAALLFAVYPNHMGYSVGLYSEPLFTALLLLLFLLIRPDAPTWQILVAGAVGGLATLVKAQALLLAPLMFVALGLAGWTLAHWRHAITRAAIATLVMAATIAPWTWRNAVVMGAPVPVSTNGGMSLLAGNNPSMTTSLREDYNDRDPVFAEVRFSVADQVQGDLRAREAAWKWIKENPGRFVAMMPKKLFRLWAFDGEAEWLFQSGYSGYEQRRLVFRTVRVLNQCFYGLLLLGFALAWRQWASKYKPDAWAVPLAIVYFSALSMVFSGQSRYHAPLMPFIIAYAAWVLNRWSDRRGAIQ